MKGAVYFIAIIALSFSSCTKEKAPTIYGKWLRTEVAYYVGNIGLTWVPESPMYPYILEFKRDNTYFIYEDYSSNLPEGSFHLDARKGALVFEEYSRIIPFPSTLKNEIQIVALEANLLWPKNDQGFAVKFKRYYE